MFASFACSVLIPEVFPFAISGLDGVLLQLLLDVRACQRKIRLLWEFPRDLTCEDDDLFGAKHACLSHR